MLKSWTLRILPVISFIISLDFSHKLQPVHLAVPSERTAEGMGRDCSVFQALSQWSAHAQINLPVNSSFNLLISQHVNTGTMKGCCCYTVMVKSSIFLLF